MLMKVYTHFRLTYRLLQDKRINAWRKAILIFLPLAYSLIPVAFEVWDFVPVVGLLDDFLLMGIAMLIFTATCPPAIVNEHRLAFQGASPAMGISLEKYRHPDELRNLALGLLFSCLILLVGGNLVGLVWLFAIALGFKLADIQRGKLLANAIQCSRSQLPQLYLALKEAQAGLPATKINLFVTQNPSMNAYTFGYREPYTIVLTSSLVERLTPQEIQAVIGHELGHIHFNHVVLINLMSISVIGLERLVFNLWSRSCEYTADVIALHASGGDPKPMISALIKLASGLQSVTIDLDEFMRQVEQANARGDAAYSEMLSTHPTINNRIRRLIEISGKQQASAAQFVPAPGM